jgi:drug/metabolite transporter (DMT)-like permease
MSEKLRAHILLLAVVAIWGSTFVVVKDALNDVSPLLFNLIRFAVASICLALVSWKQLRNLTPSAIAGGAIAGFFLAMGYQFQTAGLALTTPSKSAFITGSTVILVPLLCAIPLLRPSSSARPGWNAYLGALIALIGIALMTTPSGLAANGTGRINLGDLLTMGCALTFAFHLLSLAHLAPRIPFGQLAFLQVAFATCFMAASTPLLEHSWIHPSPRLFVAITVAAVLATAVAFSVQSWAQKHLAATHTALILSAEPLFAWMTSLIFLHQGLGGRQTIGALLVLAGIVLTELFHAPTPIEAPVSSSL